MDSLDLLRSLTNGVNSKVSSNSSETEGVSYKVQTSLRGRKKGDSPIQSPSDDMKKVRDTYKEEKIEEIIEEEIIEEEIIEEEIIEEEILEENYSESYNEPSFNDDEPIFEIETDDVGLNYNNDFVEEIIEEVVEEVVEEEIEDISEHADIPVETTKNENEHKSEDTEIIINEPIINTTEKKKIDRCGNPFKRGPRNKNKEQKNKPSKVQQVLSELKEQQVLSELKEQEKLEKSELVSNAPIEEIDEVVIEKVEEPVVIAPIIEEVSSNSEIEDMLLQSVFDELQDELDISEEVEEPNNIEEETEKIEEDIEEIEEIPKEEEISVESEIEDISIEEEISKPKKVENVEKKVPKKTEKVAFEEVVFGEDVDFSFDDMDKKEEVSQVEDVNETDDKFKNCKYYGGMSVEEFLRENPNYREAMYVEYFYNKELLEELKMKGIILYKKGIYRL